MKYLPLLALAALAGAVPQAKRTSKFQFFGVSESGAEFAPTVLPGQLGKDYIWPVESSIDTLFSKGSNIFRIPILMERIIPDTMTGTTNATYEAGLTSIVNYITKTKGAYAIVDAHNYARYNGNVITDYTGFQAFWKTLAAIFATNDKVIFDCQNEPHDMGSASVPDLMQACINGVRSASATSQYIFVEGDSYSGAWTWLTAGNDALSTLTDPSDKIVYEMHQYLDVDGSGTNATCANGTVGSERLQVATQWLKTKGKQGIIGEFAGSILNDCENAVVDMLSYMGNHTDVWMGAIWWGAGPWWGDKFYNMEPSSGVAYKNILPLMTKELGISGTSS